MSTKYAEPEYEELGHVLRAAIAASRHTQAALAQELFVAQVAVNHWLQGNRRPAPANLGQIAALLYLDPVQLISLAGYEANFDACEKILNAYEFRRKAMGEK